MWDNDLFDQFKHGIPDFFRLRYCSQQTGQVEACFHKLLREGINIYKIRYRRQLIDLGLFLENCSRFSFNEIYYIKNNKNCCLYNNFFTSYTQIGSLNNYKVNKRNFFNFRKFKDFFLVADGIGLGFRKAAIDFLESQRGSSVFSRTSNLPDRILVDGFANMFFNYNKWSKDPKPGISEIIVRFNRHIEIYENMLDRFRCASKQHNYIKSSDEAIHVSDIDFHQSRIIERLQNELPREMKRKFYVSLFKFLGEELQIMKTTGSYTTGLEDQLSLWAEKLVEETERKGNIRMLN